MSEGDQKPFALFAQVDGQRKQIGHGYSVEHENYPDSAVIHIGTKTYTYAINPTTGLKLDHAKYGSIEIEWES